MLCGFALLWQCYVVMLSLLEPDVCSLLCTSTIVATSSAVLSVIVENLADIWDGLA